MANEQHDEKGQPLSNTQLRANFMAPSVLEAANQLGLDVEQKRRLIAAARDIWNQVVSEKENEMNAQMAAPVLRLQAGLSHPIGRMPVVEALNECQKLWRRYSTKKVASLS